MPYKVLPVAFACMLLTGCWANILDEGAERVVIVNSLPASSYACTFRGEVVGSQGNTVTGRVTSTKTLVKGARNDLRNEADRIGANVVVITDTYQDLYESGSVRAITYLAKAYRCESH